MESPAPWTPMMCWMPVFLMPVLVQFVEPEQMDQPPPPPPNAHTEGDRRGQRAEPQGKETKEKDPEVKKEKPQKPKEWKTPKHVFKPTMVQAFPWTLEFAKCNSMHSVFSKLAATFVEDDGIDEAFEELPKETAKPEARVKAKAKAKKQETQLNLMKNACSQTERAISNESSSQTGSYNNLTQFYQLEQSVQADETNSKSEAEAKPETKRVEVCGDRHRREQPKRADQAEKSPAPAAAPAAGQVFPDLPGLPSADEEEEKKEERQEPAGLPPEAQEPERGKPVLSDEGVRYEDTYLTLWKRMQPRHVTEDDFGDVYDSVVAPGMDPTPEEALIIEKLLSARKYLFEPTDLPHGRHGARAET